jgi:hypothetical protein
MSARTADHPQNRRAQSGARTRPRWQISREINGLGREVEVKNGRWVLIHEPAKPAAPKPVLHYFPDD